MRLDETYFGDFYDEFSPGEDIEGECVVCLNYGKCRVITTISVKTGKIRKIGPIDRYCAYTLKYQTVPPYHTYPSTRKQLLYRYLTRKEIRSDSLVSQRIRRNVLSAIVAGFYMFLILFGISSLIFLGITYLPESITKFLLLPFVLLILIVIILSKYHQFLNIIIGKSDKTFTWKNMTDDVPLSEFLSKLPLFTLRNGSEMLIGIFVLSQVLGGLFAVLLIISMIGILAFVYLAPFAVFTLILIPVFLLSKSEPRRWFIQIISGTFFGKLPKRADKLFEEIWSGELHLETPGRVQVTTSLISGILAVSLAIAIPVLDPNIDFVVLITSTIITDTNFYFSSLLDLIGLSGFQFVQICFLLSITMTFYFMTGLFVSDILRFHTPPEDIQIKLRIKYKETLKNENRPRRRLISETPFVQIIDGEETIQLKCLICNQFIYEGETVSCENCAALYHAVHKDKRLPKNCLLCGEVINLGMASRALDV